MTKQNNLLGILLSFLGYTIWVAADTFIKLAGQTLPIIEIVFINLFTGALGTALAASLSGGSRKLLTKKPMLHLLRSILSLISTYGTVIGIIYLSLANFYTIAFTAPLIVTILGSIFLKEKVDLKMWMAIIFGFVGVLCAVQFADPTKGQFSWIGVAVTSLAALAFAFSTLTVRSAAPENIYALTFWPDATNSLILLLVMVFLGSAKMNPIGIIYSVLCGIFGVLGAFLTNASVRVAPIAVVSPYHYTQIVGGAAIGYLIWGHVPSWSVVLGAIMITLSGLYILHAEASRKQLDPSKATFPV